MIDAADEFAAASMTTLIAIRVAIMSVPSPFRDKPPGAAWAEYRGDEDPFAAISRADGRVDELHHRLARVQLLFALDSNADKAARGVIGASKDALRRLKRDPPDVELAVSEYAVAYDRSREFMAAVRSALR